MKVLIISHNVLSDTSNMGKTIMSYFNDFQPCELAQFYIHSEIPTIDKCKNYFRFTDKDALKSIFFRNRGEIFDELDIEKNKNKFSRDTGKYEKLYQFGRKRSSMIYFLRNMLWFSTHWFSKKLKMWIDEIKPDVVYFASGDYAFMYNIALKIANYAKCKLVISCMDDFYFNKQNEGILGNMIHKHLLKYAKKIFDKASFAITICDKMAIDYEKNFKKKCYVLYTGVNENITKKTKESKYISYIGNLGCDRYLQIIDIGKTLLELRRQNEPMLLDVYSSENRDFVLKKLTRENGIRFHGQIDSEEVVAVMDNSIAVIHTESFDEKMQNRVKYSISTKIAESLMNGPCIIAYGPKDVASFQYLEQNLAAFMIHSKEELPKKLDEIISNAKLREEIVTNARKLAIKNHRIDINGKKVREWFESLLEGENIVDENITN